MANKSKIVSYIYYIILILAFAGVLSLQLYTDYYFNNAIATTNYFALIIAVAIFAPLAFMCYSGRFRLSLSDVLIVALILLAVINSKEGLQTKEVVMSLAYGTLYLSLRVINSRFEIFPKLASTAILVLGIQQSILVIKQVVGLETAHNYNFLVSGDFFNPGPCGILLGAVFVLATSIVRRNKIDFTRGILTAEGLESVRCIIAYFALLLSLIAIVPTLSRAGWVGAAVGVVVVYYKDISESVKLMCRKVNISFKVGIIVVSMLAVTLLFGVYLMKQGSADGRLFIWQNTISAYMESPIVGVGVGNFAESYSEAQIAYFESRQVLINDNHNIAVVGTPEYPFNEFLSILLLLGGVGLALVIVILYLKLCQSTRSEYKAVVIATLVSSIFSYTFYIPLIAFLCIFGLAAIQESEQLKIHKFVTLGVVVTIPLLFYLSICGVKADIYANEKWGELSTSYSYADYEIVADESKELEPYLDDNHNFLFEYGHSLNKCGRYEESNQVLLKGVKCTTDPMFWAVIGSNYLALKEYDNSERAYLRSFYLCPNRLYPIYLLTKLFEEVGNDHMMQYYGRLLLNRAPKIKSSAVDEMKDEITKLIVK